MSKYLGTDSTPSYPLISIWSWDCATSACKKFSASLLRTLQLQLYTYASPRVGDQIFAEAHGRLIPNSYRVVNLADVITLVPPTKLNGTYVHIGQEWAFLSQNGDILPNHVVDTYPNAIKRGLESYTANTYLNLLRDG